MGRSEAFKPEIAHFIHPKYGNESDSFPMLTLIDTSQIVAALTSNSFD